MERVKEKAPASGGAETSASEIFTYKSITPIGENVKREEEKNTGSGMLKILIACEESQTVCTEMRRLGHETYSADIQEPSGGHPEWHILGDVLPLINGKCRFTTMDGTTHQIDGKWDLLIAHPPCTYLSSVTTRHLSLKCTPPKKVVERFWKLAESAVFFMQFALIESFPPTPTTSASIPAGKTETKPVSVSQEQKLTPPASDNAAKENDFIEAVPDPVIPSDIPKALADLMISNRVSEEEIRRAVLEKGYYPYDMPVGKYDKGFIEGVLIGAWAQVEEMVMSNRYPF